MLLDPFEKQFDLPPALIKDGDGNRGQGEVVGQKHQPLVGLGVAKSDATQRRVEVLARVKAGEHDGLIANQPRFAVDGMRIRCCGCPCDRACPLMLPGKLDVAQAFAVGKLRERHAEIPIEARKRFDFVFAPVTRYAATKRRQWQMLHDLREHQLAHGYRCPLRMSSSQDGKYQRRSSNRDRNKTSIIYSSSIGCGRTIDRRWDTTVTCP
jgi:hypothetical protein